MEKTEEKFKAEDTSIAHTILCAVFASVTTLAFSAFELYFTNKEELWFSFWDIFLPFLLLTICVAGVLFGISFLVGKVSKGAGSVIVSLIFSLGLGFYIQGNYIVTDYGVLDGTAINWVNYTGTAMIGALIWSICLAVPLILLHIRFQWFERLVKWGSGFIIAIEIITVVVLLITVGPTKEGRPIFTTKNQFHISQQKNVIVFITDALDASYADEMLKQYPEVYEEFKDFTYYNDTSGICTTTKGSLPVILTGELYLNKPSYQDYLEQAYQQSPIIKTAAEKGYSIDIYTNDLVSANSAERVITNLHSMKTEISNLPGFLEYYFRLISFRNVPDFMKPFFWISGNEFDTYRKVEDGLQTYSVDNHSFYQDLTEQRLQPDRETPVLKVYHIQGAHAPLLIDENVNSVSPEETTIVKTVRGCFRIIGEYISQLKDLGLYEDAFIVIMADHGSAFAQCPAMMIKEVSVEQEKLSIDSTPTSYILNWPDIIMSALEGKKDSVHDIILSGQEQTRPFYYYTWDSSMDGKYLPDIYEYQISSAAREMSLVNDQTGKVYRRPTGQKYQYKLGEQILISDESFCQNAVKEGVWLTTTRSHAWISDYAKIEMYLDKTPKSNLKLRMSTEIVNGYSQTVALSVNGVQLNDGGQVYLGDPVKEWIIPQRVLKDKQLTLEFYCPEAAEFDSVAGKASIGISDILLTETEDEQILENALPQPLDHEIVITMGDAEKIDSAVQVRGIYQEGGTFAWTAEKATFSFVRSPATNDVIFTIEYGTFYDEPDAIVMLNGHEIGRLQNPYAVETLALPQEYFNQDGLQTVEIQVPNATSPFLYGYSHVRRVLGLCISTVEITPSILDNAAPTE